MTKKILFISSYAPPTISGGPKIIYTMLRDLPPDSYSILTSFFAIDNISADLGDWLPGKYIFYDNPKFDRLSIDTKKIKKSFIVARSFLAKLKYLAKRVKIIRSIIGIPIVFKQIFSIVRLGKKSVLEGNVDMLFGFSDYGPAMIGTYLIHTATKKPYSIYMLDLYRDNNFPFPGNLMANIFEPKIFRGAKNIIVTNHGTLNYYKKRYDKNIIDKMVVIHHSINENLYPHSQDLYNPKSPYTILFTGGIYWPQIGSLKNLIEAVNHINDLDVRLKIYSPNPKDYLNKIGIKESSKVSIDVASPQNVPNIQSSADILYLPLSWNTESQAIIDTATPGKIVDYLISGKPILIHAPASTYLVKYAKEYDFGAVVEEENIEMLQKSIKHILTDKKYAQYLIKNARETFYKNHNIKDNIKVFYSLIS